jgi:hypothetical protein
MYNLVVETGSPNGDAAVAAQASQRSPGRKLVVALAEWAAVLRELKHNPLVALKSWLQIVSSCTEQLFSRLHVHSIIDQQQHAP